MNNNTTDIDVNINATTDAPTTATTTISPPDAILYPWLVQLLGIVALFLLTRFNISIPYAAVMFVLGACMGAGSSLLENENALSRSITQWTNIDSGLLLLVFLPGLIFKDAVTIPIHLFLVALLQIWILAFPMVLLGTALTALVGFYVLPYDWPWQAAATLGAILASTDPIAVSSVLKTAGASPRLVMHISGESLLNDGSSFVFFTIFSQLFYIALGVGDEDTPESVSVGEGFALFFRMSLGGTVVGAVFGAGLVFILWELDRRLEREFDILQVAAGLTVAYLCYFVCDQILIMSGVVAVVTLGVIVNYFARGLINDESLMESYLMLAEYLLNTLLFTLGGTIWASISFENQESYQVQGVDWGWLMVLYLFVGLIRFVQVGCFYPVISRIGLKSDWREATFLAYGGLRGSVGVALGLSLVRHVFEQTDDWDIRKLITIVQFMGGGVTLLTLSINGTTAGPVLKLLGLAKPAVSSDRTKVLFEGMAMDFVYEQITQLYQEPRFQNVQFETLKKYVPFVTSEPPKRESEDTNGRMSNLTTLPLQSFNRRLQAAGGNQYLQVVEMTHRVSETIANAAEKEQMLVEMRTIFLELLNEAYNMHLDMGELDLQEDNGFLFETLQASVNLAKNEVEHNHSKIQDWKWTQKFLFLDTQFGGRSSSIVSSADESSELQMQRAPRSSSLLSLRSNMSVTSRKKVSAKRIRQDVVRAIAFQQGHEIARAKLELYINRMEPQATDAKSETLRAILEQVKEESLKQVCLANETIEQEMCKDDFLVAMTYYCARILVRRLMKFTERKADDGMIGKSEARQYLSMMDARTREIVKGVLDQLMNEQEQRESSLLEQGLGSLKEEEISDARLHEQAKGDGSNEEGEC
ncbi:MAG: hypothetical protein SGILL_005292 [Bacillariaceae sp.]